MTALSPLDVAAGPELARRARVLAETARVRIASNWIRLGACAIVAATAAAVLGNSLPFYWLIGMAGAILIDRALFKRLQRRCEEGTPPRHLRGLIAWTAAQSVYGNTVAVLFWFAPYVSGQPLAVFYLCGGIANAAATLRGHNGLMAAGAGATAAFMLALPVADYALSGASNPMRLLPLVAAIIILGFGVNLWRSLKESDAAQARAEAAAIRERQAAAEAAAAKSATIKRMRDELRTPMRALIGAAEHLRRAAASAEARAHIATLVQAGEVLRLVLDDLSDLDRLENGQVAIEPKPADPREIARGVVSAFRAAAQDKHLELFLDIARDVPAAVEIDAARVRQILFNLVANAVRFTVHGGVRVSVGKQAAEEPGRVRLYFIVADTGAGMSRSHLAMIFGRARVSEDGAGPGLGLSISLRLARLMGAQLNATSELGQGSVFTLSLDAPIVVAAGRDAA